MPDSNAEARERILALAQTRVGIPYRLDPPPDGVTTLDCSLYIVLTYRDAGLPFSAGVRTAEQIRQDCEHVDFEDVEAGDLLFFEHTYEPSGQAGPDGLIASHVGISLGAGSGRMWDCHESTNPSRPDGVGQTNIQTDYWQPKLFDARRPRGLAASGEAPPTQTYRLTDSGVRLRAAPTTGAAILVPDLGFATQVTDTGAPLRDADGHRWRQVRTAAGVVGWAAAEYLEPLGASSETLPNDPDHVFTFAELWPHIQAAAERHGANARVLAAIVAQESSFTNWRVHQDGHGHGLIGLDDRGLLPDFESWSGLAFGRGQDAASISPTLQLEFGARTLAAFAERYGSALNAARVWHRGPGAWMDEQGDYYDGRIRAHIAALFS